MQVFSSKRENSLPYPSSEKLKQNFVVASLRPPKKRKLRNEKR